ncbi:hypothetical protein [Gloeobacter kilaueensis]|uniref:Uncharacterized protein n=1 Tax=Gloeobacter kilaueensis (strain ATCC BAA-2537 / CCAP 1431/1 / ULC 316 / JS1) TaxID=1183438 RepID=U5QL72_GLOK1|nr:hypothetical protein [Gloeobacter kilaueensis]AGY59742.1 hypothetical protein GKIL_3496 [Gloeobacter kilaueensis JS1]
MMSDTSYHLRQTPVAIDRSPNRLRSSAPITAATLQQIDRALGRSGRTIDPALIYGELSKYLEEAGYPARVYSHLPFGLAHFWARLHLLQDRKARAVAAQLDRLSIKPQQALLVWELALLEAAGEHTSSQFALLKRALDQSRSRAKKIF